VMDNGDGIPPEFQSRVFDMFYRAHKKARGPGLGLYIVRHIIERLNGKISLQSEKNIGTTITLMIPVPSVLPAVVKHV
jgi:signal transduction histidine kinase